MLPALRKDVPRHAEYRAWFSEVAAAEEPFAVSDGVLAAVVRITTNPRAFNDPDTTDEALAIVAGIRAQPSFRELRAGPYAWEIFERLCRESSATGNLVANAHHAAVAIEHGCEWITADRDFARFRGLGLRLRHPLEAKRTA